MSMTHICLKCFYYLLLILFSTSINEVKSLEHTRVFEGTEDAFTPTKQIIAPASPFAVFQLSKVARLNTKPCSFKGEEAPLGGRHCYSVDFRVESSTLGPWKFLFIVLKGSIWFNQNFKGDGRYCRFLDGIGLLQHNGKRLMSQGICSLHLLLYVRCCIQPAIFRNISKSESVRLFPLLNEDKATS